MPEKAPKSGINLPRWVLYAGGGVVFLVVGGVMTYFALREEPYRPLPPDYFKTHPQNAIRQTKANELPGGPGDDQPKGATTGPAGKASD